MVLDSAFLLSLIFTAVVTLLMIIVFAEIAEAIGIALPTFDQILGSPTILIAMENTFSLFVLDQSAAANQVQHFGTGTLPAGAELRSVTFFNRGFAAGP